MNKTSYTPIADMLKKIAEKSQARFCMPGHKGREAFLNGEAAKFDITELSGADNLYNPGGVISQSQKNYADFIGAKDCFFLVNGSSTGVQASVMSVLKPDDEVIAARNFHLSAAHAFALTGAVPRFVCSGVKDFGDFSIIGADDIKRAIKKHPNAKAIYVTYPDYYGRCADLAAICEIAHGAGMKAICDAAHAAAFDYSAELPVSPAEAGCDIWTVSLHKTLPAMNQCAVLCTGKESGIDRALVQNRLNLIQTTSPSYILLASSEYALNFMREKGEAELRRVIDLVFDIKHRIDKLGGYKCLTEEEAKNDGASNLDLLKLTIDVSGRGFTGFEAAAELEKSGIYIESADIARILLICTVADKKSDFDKLYNALDRMGYGSNNAKATHRKLDIEEIFDIDLRMDIRGAVFAPRECVPLKQAAGRISAVCAGAYPPGVPVIIPGQKITAEAVEYLTVIKDLGYSLFGCDENIGVVKI